MTVTELIAECEILQKPLLSDPSHGVGFRSWKLLPLLLSVIKNQQRQIEVARGGFSAISFKAQSIMSINQMDALAAELEDIK